MTGAYNATFTVGKSVNWRAAVVTFKAADIAQTTITPTLQVTSIPTVGLTGNPTPAPIATCKTDLTSQLSKLHSPGLSAAIVKNGQVVCTAVAGMADTTKNIPVTPDTDFLWASVSKTVTVTALMELFDQGKFKLDDDINKYLPFKVSIPSCPNTPITFRELLTHTSSIKDNNLSVGDNVDNSVPGDSPILLADFVKGYLTPGGTYYKRKKNFKKSCPGTVSDYSNIGITLAGYLVEVLSGQSFCQYTQNNVFTPLDMPNSSFKLAGLNQSLIALPNGNGILYGEPDYPAGMLRTTPTLLGHLLIMYMQGGQYNGKQILKSTTVQRILTSQTALGSASSNGITQGLVWYTVNTFGPITWGHDGDDNGAASNMFFDPTTHTGVLMVSNGEWSGDPGAVSTMDKLFQEAAGY